MIINFRHIIRTGLSTILLLVVATSLGACSALSSTPTNTSTSASTNTSAQSASAASLSSLSEFTVMPASPNSLKVGESLQFIATGIYADNSTADITSQVKWASSDKKIASISSNGIVTGLVAGTTNITGTVRGASTPPIVLNVVAP